MNSMNDTLQNISSGHRYSTMDIIGIIGFILTIAALVFAFYTWNESKKKDKLYQQIFDAAANSLKTEETEEKLKTKQNELSDVSNKLELIRKSIPVEARRAILTDRLYSAQQSLQATYDEATSLQNELTKLDNSNAGQIPEEFLSKIQNLIEPKFIVKERIDNLKTTLTILTTLASVSFALVPMIGRILGGVFFVMALPVLVKLIREYLLFKETNHELVNVKMRMQLESFLILILVGILTLTLYMTLFSNFSSVTDFGWKIIYSINVFSPFLIALIGFDLVRQRRRKRKLLMSAKPIKTI